MEKLTVPTLSVIDDFELYLTFLKAREKIPVTNSNNHLKQADLHRLNEEMHFKAAWVNPKSMQPKYSLLQFFYHVVLTAAMARLHHEKQGAFLRVNPEVLEHYELLNRTEKYFFLLETAWCYLDYEELTDNRSLYFLPGVLALLKYMSEIDPGMQLEVQEQKVEVPG